MKTKMNVKLTVKNKLLLGFGAVILLMVGVSINTFTSLAEVATIEYRLLHLRFPTVLAGAQLENGINLSLSGLRGYMILGKNPKKGEAMKKARLAGWKEIDGAMDQMREFSKVWTNPKNIEKLKEMETYVEVFRQAQEEVEKISHTDEEVPAFKTLLTQAAPRAGKILKAISAMIDEEAVLAATPERKKLLKLMADSRGSFAIGLANIRAYLLSGDIKFQDNFNAKWKVNSARFKQISSMTGVMTSSQRKAWNTYSNTRAEFAKYPPLMFKQRSGKDWNLANYWLSTKAAPQAKAIMGILQGMRVNQDKLAEADQELLVSETYLMEVAILMGTVTAFIISVVIAIFLSRSIVIPLKRVVDRAKDISDGDLTGNPLEITGNDELAELTVATNEMGSSLQDIIQQISNSAHELSAASEQLQSTATKTTQGMDSQRSEIDMVATAMNEMSATVQEVAQNASLAATSASEADNAASTGRVLVSQNMSGINQLAQSIDNASQTINKLGEDTNSVDSIVDVITGIAEQTNLLALNAAIEAARAGEQGRGFAVVADEVRTLAGRTQESTEEIRTMLDKLKVGASDAVKAMDEGHEQAKASVEQAKNASDSIDQITQAVTAINEMNTQIATAAEEQSSVAEEMNRSVVQISSEAESTLESTRETSAAAEQVRSLSSNMQQIVSRFRI
ncbi:MAG: methyl-accepting chemotaxis protein [Woeseiaceae bacterium]